MSFVIIDIEDEMAEYNLLSSMKTPTGNKQGVPYEKIVVSTGPESHVPFKRGDTRLRRRGHCDSDAAG